MAEERNIIWTSEAEPPNQVSIGMLPTFDLPDAETQRKGFYHEHALRLIKSVDGFKQFVETKGRRKTTVLDTAGVEET